MTVDVAIGGGVETSVNRTVVEYAVAVAVVAGIAERYDVVVSVEVVIVVVVVLAGPASV